MTVEKPKPKQLPPTNHNRNEQRDEPITIPAITCNSLEARENHAYMVRLVLVLLLIG